MTREFNITNYPCSSGGCLLTNREFAKKLRDLFIRRVTVKDVNLLKVGRHFRFGKNRTIVVRNEEENKLLLRAKTEMWLALLGSKLWESNSNPERTKNKSFDRNCCTLNNLSFIHEIRKCSCKFWQRRF